MARAVKSAGKKKAPKKAAKPVKRKPAAKRPAAKRPTRRRPASSRRTKRSGGQVRRRAGFFVGLLMVLALAGLTISLPGAEDRSRSAPKQLVSAELPRDPPSDPPKTERAPKLEVMRAPEEPAPETVEEKAPAKTTREAPPATAASAPAVKDVQQQTATAPPSKESPRQLPAWQRFAAAYQAAPGQPRIAIVLDDLGLNKGRTRTATALPGPLTMAFLPYAKDLPAQTAEARRRGHELLIHMPMEPRDMVRNDPGPQALLRDLSSDEIKRRLDWAMDSFPAHVGINNHMGSAFTADGDSMRLVMQHLASHGLLFLDSVTSGSTEGTARARAEGVPAIARDVFLDHGGDDPGLVLAQLAELERIAERQGYAVAIGHPHEGTLTALELWIPDALSRGFALVPISALVGAPAKPRLRG